MTFFNSADEIRILQEGEGGIPPSTEFQIMVRGWPQRSGFGGAANIPEPGTISLFLIGMGAVAARRRKQTGSGSRV